MNNDEFWQKEFMAAGDALRALGCDPQGKDRKQLLSEFKIPIIHEKPTGRGSVYIVLRRDVESKLKEIKEIERPIIQKKLTTFISNSVILERVNAIETQNATIVDLLKNIEETLINLKNAWS